MTDSAARGVQPIEVRSLGLDELFYRIRDAVIVGDAGTGRVLLWNDAAVRLFGYTAAEAIGLTIEDLVPASLKAAHRRGLERFAQTGHGALVDSSQIVELPAVRKDGAEIIVELSLTPLESERLPGRYAMAVVRDVTERRHAEKRVQEALELERDVTRRLRDLDELKNVFVATVAHDVRSPMAAIIGFAEMLRDASDRLDEPGRERALEAILRSARSVVRLVEDVLQVAALDSGELPYNIEPVDLPPIARRAVDEAQAAHPETRFAVELDDEAARVSADPERLWQILTNLIANAARFSPPAGVVVVSARRAANAMIEVGVSDSGPGIPERERPRLFEKFARLDTEPREGVPRGTGLGLYLCRALVEAQGGRIWLDGSVERGATFRFTLPAA